MSYRISAVVLCLALTACASAPEPGPPPPPEGDLSYLLTADPSTVTSAELATHAAELEDHYMQYHDSYGVVFQAYRDSVTDAAPTWYGGGGDSLLFTGYRLAACVYRYKVTGLPDAKAKVLDAVRGLYILTHATGTPGVLCRSAFPEGREADWRFPAMWQGRIDNGFVHTGPALPDPLNPSVMMPRFTYYTRCTRDQLTGLLYGLGVSWAELQGPDPELAAARQVVAQIVEDVYNHLVLHDFRIRDENGLNDTSADEIDALLMLQLLAVYRHTVSVTNPGRYAQISTDYHDALDGLLCKGFYWSDTFNRFNNVYYIFGIKVSSYYSWNLRHARIFTIWRLESGRPFIQGEILDYFEGWIWKHVAGHRNAFFTLTHDAMAGVAPSTGVWSLQSLSLRPLRGWCSPVAEGMPNAYDEPSQLSRFLGLADDDVLPPHLKEPTTYWTWQEDPWRNGVSEPSGSEESTGLGFLLPYWFGRYYGLVP